MKEINPSDLESRQVYKLLTGSVIPRPIAWVSSVSEDGIYNLAPFSYFMAVSANPPTILFSSGMRKSPVPEKDTYSNVKASGEFVVNFVNVANAEAMNITATEVPPEVDEFERAGLTPIDSRIVNVPRVKESPIHFECKVSQVVDVGDNHVVLGEVVYMHFDEAIFKDNYYIDVEAYNPLARLSGPQYASLAEVFELQRPPSEIKQG